MSLKNDFASSIKYHAEQIASLVQREKIAEELGWLEREYLFGHFSSYGDSINLTFHIGEGESVKRILAELEPFVGVLEREFAEGNWRYRAEYKGVKLEISETAPTCAYVVEEEEVVVPAEPERTETKKVYRLVDPNCGEKAIATEEVPF